MKKNSFYIFVLGFILFSCRGTEPTVEMEADYYDGFNVLLEYMESEKNYINGPAVPFFMFAPEVYNNLDNNYLVIDLRSPEEYKESQIFNSVNVQLNELLDFFENTIKHNQHSRIVLVCNNGKLSIIAAMGLKYLGYINVLPMRNGLSSWDREIAEKHWLSKTSDKLVDNLSMTGSEKNPVTEYPVLKTKYSNGYDIMRQRIKKVFQEDHSNLLLSIDDYLSNPDDYYLISYWPKDRYEKGHIHNSVRYEPKQDIHSTKYLNTLPTDKKIVIQCYSGYHSGFVSTFLRILGYDALNLKHGANSFMYSIIKEEEVPGRHFADKDIYNFPLSNIGESELYRID